MREWSRVVEYTRNRMIDVLSVENEKAMGVKSDESTLDEW